MTYKTKQEITSQVKQPYINIKQESDIYCWE